MKEMDLKESYALHLKVGFLGAVVLLVAGFAGFPSYSPDWSIPEVGAVEDTIIYAEPVIPPEAAPPPLPRPAIPEEAKSPREVQVTTIPADSSFFNQPPRDVWQPPPPDSFIVYDEPPRKLRVVKPDYPDIARMAGLEGTVWLNLLIDTQGEVRDVIVISGINPACDSAAVRAVKQFLFSPALQRGRPVTVWASLKVDFRLTE